MVSSDTGFNNLAAIILYCHVVYRSTFFRKVTSSAIVVWAMVNVAFNDLNRSFSDLQVYTRIPSASFFNAQSLSCAPAQIPTKDNKKIVKARINRLRFYSRDLEPDKPF